MLTFLKETLMWARKILCARSKVSSRLTLVLFHSFWRQLLLFVFSILLYTEVIDLELQNGWWYSTPSAGLYQVNIKTSLTFKCLIEHLFTDFSYSRPLDTYLWKQMIKMNKNITYKWCYTDKKHLLFTKRKCHKFSWLFIAYLVLPDGDRFARAE